MPLSHWFSWTNHLHRLPCITLWHANLGGNSLRRLASLRSDLSPSLE
jgi:hypothetical protein